MSKILPNSNLKDHEVRNMLNRHGGKTNNVFGSKYRQTANVKKWSKKKPTKNFRLLFETGSENPPRWKADDGLCGFREDSVFFNVLEDMVNAYKNDGTFVYELPTGTEDYPYRSGDFLGYNPDAKSPIWSFDVEGQIDMNTSGLSYATFTILGNSDIDEDTNLTLQDIAPRTSESLSEYKFGIVVAMGSSIVTYIVSDSKIGSGKGFSASATLTSSDLWGTGSYMAYPMLVRPDGKAFTPCPINPIPFKVIATDLSSKLGWMRDGTAYYEQVGGKKNFYGTLAYFNGQDNTVSFEGFRPTIYAKVYHKNGQVEILTQETITLTADRSEGNVNYMDVTLSASSYTADGDVFALEVFYDAASYDYGDEVVVSSKKIDL